MNFNNPYFKNMAQNLSNSQIRETMKNLDSMPDDQLKELMKMSGLGNFDLNTFRNLNKNVNLSDENINNMKKSSFFTENHQQSSNNKSTTNNEKNNLKNDSIERLFLNKFEIIKAEGNRLFRNGELKEAKEKYYELLNNLNLISNFKSIDEEKQIKDLILTTRLNITNCLIKLNENELAIYECKNILKEKESFKAYYRLGIALYNKKEYSQSKISFHKAEEFSNCSDEKKSLTVYLEKLNECLPKQNNDFSYKENNINDNKSSKNNIFEETKCQDEIQIESEKSKITDDKIDNSNIIPNTNIINNINDDQIDKISEFICKNDETLKALLTSQGKTVSEEELKIMKNPSMIKFAYQQLKNNPNLYNDKLINKDIQDINKDKEIKIDSNKHNVLSSTNNLEGMNMNGIMDLISKNPDILKNLGGLFGTKSGEVPPQIETILYLLSIPQRINSFVKSTRGIITIGLIFVLIISYFICK